MSINEEITALLNGDLDDEARIAELMHVLAVSPEKRSLLQQQIRMSRAFNTMGSGIVPPQRADQAILAGITAIDTMFAGEAMAPANQPPSPAPLPMAPADGAGSAIVSGSAFAWLRTFVLGVVLMGLGLGAGYLLWHENPEPAVAARPELSVTNKNLLAAGLRDSLEQTRLRLAALSAQHQDALGRIAALQNRPAVRQEGGNSGSGRVGTTASLAPRGPARAQALPPVTDAPPAIHEIAPVTLRAPKPAVQELPAEALPSKQDATPLSSTSYLEAYAAAGDSSLGPWSIGMRDHFRLSLPRVYGLAGSRSILFDKEVFLSCKLAADKERTPLSLLRVALAVGETQFTQVYHEGDAGNLADLIVEQSPTVLYGRVLLASDVFRTGPLSGSIELGTGGTMVEGRALGPIGTFGVNMEYNPVDMLSLHVGASSWLLWTEYNGQVYTSTNLNGHLGVALGF